jgi:hypothetical protein
MPPMIWPGGCTEDHRGDPAYEQWDLDRDQFFKTYRAEIEEALGSDYYEFAMME